MSMAQGILKGLLGAGLGHKQAVDEFYGDLIKNAALNIGGASQTAINSFPTDIEDGKKEYKKYLSLVETLGKDRADYIALNTEYLKADNYMALSKQVTFPKDFKYTGKTEPIDAMNERINKDISGVTDQLTNASSMRGMKKYTDFYLGQVPDKFALDPSRLSADGTQVAMTEEQRTAAAGGVILPTEILSESQQNMADMAILNKMGGNIELAMQTYDISEGRLNNAKFALQNQNPSTKAAMNLVSTQNYEIAVAGGNPKLIQAEIYNLTQNIETMTTMIESLNAVSGSDAGVQQLSGIVEDDTVFLYQGQELKFKNILKLFRKNNKDIPDADLRQLVLEQLDNANATIVTRT